MSESLRQAVRWAVERHDGQVRDGEPAIPYAAHPLDVMTILRTFGCQDETLLCAACLHDLVEETSTTNEEIRAEFGGEVAELVEEVTRQEPSAEEIEGMTKDEIWELRTVMLLEEIKGMSERAQFLKLADRLSNLREALVTRTGKKLERYIRQTRMILQVIPKRVQPELWQRLKKLSDDD